MMYPTGFGKEMFKLNDKPLGFNNLVISTDATFIIKDKKIQKTVREYIHASKEFLAEFDYRGVYLVRQELIDKLKKIEVPYFIIGKYPIPKKVREEIRRNLKKNGIVAPL